ncbi:LOW QUALITY PROTEIN: VRTN-like protein, partial [Mya arenaria]
MKINLHFASPEFDSSNIPEWCLTMWLAAIEEAFKNLFKRRTLGIWQSPAYDPSLSLYNHQYYYLRQKTLCKVKHFFIREDIATPLPQKRYASKHGPGYVMQVTLLVAFTLFKKENPDCRIGLTKFTALRPKNVRLLTTCHWNYCVCLICQNVSYKLKTLNRFLQEKIKDFNQLFIILCPKSDAQQFHSVNCLFRSCDKCKDTKSRLLSFFDSTNQKVDDSLVTRNHWEKVVEDGKPRKVLRTKRKSFTDMFEELLTDIVQPFQGSSFAEHLFVGNWQQHQFSELNKNLPNDSVLLIMDYGKNRTVRYQDEPKSVFFTAQQITIYPVVAFYHSLHIPNLLKSLEYLNDIGIKFSKLYVFSDGCAGQYKGKGSFADLSLKSIHVDRSYFGSDHGKSECDGELGSINRAVDLTLVGRKVIIKNAEDMSSWCSTSNLSLDEAGSKRTFLNVRSGEINLPTEGKETFVNGREEECANKTYTGEFEERSLHPTNAVHQLPKTRSTLQPTSEVLPNTSSTIQLNEKGLARQEESGDQHAGKSTEKQTIKTKPTMSSCEKKTSKQDPKLVKTQVEGTLYEKVVGCSTYEALKHSVIQMEIPPLPRLPDNMKDLGLFPSTVYGDGNCLPRCASLFVYGSEEHHLEMRARIVCDLVKHEDKYLDNQYLREGADTDGRTNIAKMFAMFSEHFYNEQLTDLAIQRIFRAEIMNICNSGRYMGIWQVAALANFLNRQVVSVYPMYGGQTIRNFLHRTFEPEVEKKEMTNSDKVFIMWSNLNGPNIAAKEWRPNHFVPLLFTSTDKQNDGTLLVEDSEEEMSPLIEYDDDDSSDLIFNSIFLDHIIEGQEHISEEVYRLFMCCEYHFHSINTDNIRQADQSHVTESKIWDNNMDITSDVDQICADNPVHENTDNKKQADQSHVTETKIEVNNMDITSDVDQICADNPVHEACITDDNQQIHHEVVSLSTNDTNKCTVGDFILANFGSQNCPCIVIQTPNNMEALPGVGVWVECLKKVRASRWTLEEKPFFVENINIGRSLEYPSLTAA